MKKFLVGLVQRTRGRDTVRIDGNGGNDLIGTVFGVTEISACNDNHWRISA